jgi:hypothetical protein
MMARSSQAGPDSAKPTFQIITFGMQRAAAPADGAMSRHADDRRKGWPEPPPLGGYMAFDQS